MYIQCFSGSVYRSSAILTFCITKWRKKKQKEVSAFQGPPSIPVRLYVLIFYFLKGMTSVNFPLTYLKTGAWFFEDENKSFLNSSCKQSIHFLNRKLGTRNDWKHILVSNSDDLRLVCNVCISHNFNSICKAPKLLAFVRLEWTRFELR